MKFSTLGSILTWTIRASNPSCCVYAIDTSAHIFSRYPSEQEKTQLCRASKLNDKQVMNWFVNNRKRVWQPMKREQAALNNHKSKAGF
jgi:hypothetical protein